VLYGSLFLAAGAGLLAITYVLVEQATANQLFTSVRSGSGQELVVGGSPPPSIGGPEPVRQIQIIGSDVLTPDQIVLQTQVFQQLASRQHAEQMHQLLVQSGIALAAMTVVSIMLGWLVAGRVLRPLRTITAAARDISATSLHERLALDGPDDELTELGRTFDALLGRLESSFRAQRQFVANASHELRTPLARQRTLAQVALADPDASVESLRAAHERVMASGEEQERLIEALLTLTRGQAGLDRRVPFDLAALTERVVAAALPDAAHREIEVLAELSPVSVAGGSHLVERLVSNLVDNALRYNAPGGRVDVRTEHRSGRGVLSVANTGPVVPADRIEQLFEPFQRMGTARTGHGEGLGLGLSIVEAIAEAHGATVATHARPGGGLRVEVTFPRPESA
jgi:signal transduction histidine kinase